MRVLMRAVVVVGVLFLLCQQAGAQTVSSTTGAINGTVTDSSKAVIPGVTVSLSGPALMGTTTVVTEADGVFRLSTVPVGDYKLTFELPGFGTVVRQGLHVSVGFTATVNIEMNPGGVAETVTVSGASPVVDIAATSVASHFDSEKLAELPGSRDAWAVVSQAPAVAMSRMDVGGSAAWTQQGFTAYGVSGGERNEVEGILVNEGAGQMYYTDFGSFEEISVTPVGNTAEVGTPGVFSNFVSKSGSDTFHGNVYFDYETDSMEATNIDAAQIAPGPYGGLVGSQFLDVHDLNRLKLFRDFTADIGGYAKKDKLWWYFSYRNNVADLRFPTLVDDVQRSSGPVYSAKVNANLTIQHKLIGYYQHAGKQQPDYLGAIALPTGRTTPAIMHADTVWSSIYPNDISKGEYNGVLSNNLVLVVRAGAMFSNWARTGKSSGPRVEDTSNNFVSGGVYGLSLTRGRPQANGALSYFKEDWAGSHNFKLGGEIMLDALDQPFTGFTNPCQCVSVFSNGSPTQVYLFRAPSESRARLWAYTGYISDSWQLKKRLTLNLGLRLDRYRPFLPAQDGPGGEHYAAVDQILVWNNLSPRMGASWDVAGNGKTVVKFNYGKYWLYPAADFAQNENPVADAAYTRYAWRDLNSNGIWDPGEQGAVQAVNGGTASVVLDSNIKNTFQHQTMAYVEHELAPSFGIRTGFVWNARRQVYGQVNVNRPLSAYTVPISVQDPGPDGRVGTSDDGGTFTAYNLAADYLSLPAVNITRNLENSDRDYYTWEVTANRREANSWSLMASLAETWNHVAALGTGTSFTPNALINTANSKNNYRTWQAKLSATLLLPKGVRVLPVVRHQSGNAFARTFSQSLNFSTIAIKAEPFGAERTPNQTLFDVRLEKVFRFKNGRRLTGMFDLYNIFNTNVAQDATVTSGSSWLRPAAVTPPRIARLGVKLAW